MFQSRLPGTIRKLIDRLNLESVPEQFLSPDKLKVPSVINLIVDLSEVLLVPKIDAVVKDLTGVGSLAIPYWTVPKGKRWHVYRISHLATTGGTWPKIADAKGNAHNLTTAAVTTSAIYQFPKPLKLDVGGIISQSETGNPADSARQMQIYYEEEDLEQL